MSGREEFGGRILADPIKNGSVCRDIGQWSTVCINPGIDAGCSRKGEIGGNLTHFLEEREEVGAVLGTDYVTADALLSRVLPASSWMRERTKEGWVDVLKVETRKVVSIGILSERVGQRGAVLRGGDRG